MRRPTRKILVPATLAAAGTWLLVGCVYIPTFGTTMSGKNAVKSVGDARSRKPVRVTRSTLADVLRVLGEPQFATADRRVLAYPWTVRNGIAVWPLCFAAYPVRGQRTLVLRFDPEQILQSAQLLKSNEPAVNLYYNYPTQPLLPREIEDERAVARRAESAERRNSAGPTTAPLSQPR